MKKFLIFLTIIIPMCSYSQNGYYSSPMKIPLYLSASFAELRSNHFHSGIDIKTNQTTGIPVNTIADGYISRISVSPSGFGKALYVNHPNGTSSVYAHLDRFRSDIEKYVKEKQYELKSFRVDLEVQPLLFPLRKDELIAYSGNSGSSGGPHLHFEIRDTKTQDPLNPLHYDFPVADTVPPRIYSLSLVPLNAYSHVNFKDSQSEFHVTGSGLNYKLKERQVVPVFGEIGIAIQVNDYAQTTQNRYGIYSMEMKVDGETWFFIKMDRFSFSQTRAINSYIDYAEFIKTQKRFQKLWIDPGNELNVYNYSRERGVLSFRDGNPHPVKINITDNHGNLSVLEFTLKSVYTSVEPPTQQAGEVFYHNRENEYNQDGLSLQVPEGALYTDILFQHKSKPAGKKYYSKIHTIHQETTPLHIAVPVKIETTGLPERLQSKALLVKIDTLTGRIYSAGGTWNNGEVLSSIRTFGRYAVTVDTIPPQIVPLSIESGSKLTESHRLRFRIGDNLSGVDKVEGTLNGKWMLFEYDGKSSEIIHYFDPERFDLNRRHNFKLDVTDYQGNIKTYEATFWK